MGHVRVLEWKITVAVYRFVLHAETENAKKNTRKTDATALLTVDKLSPFHFFIPINILQRLISQYHANQIIPSKEIVSGKMLTRHSATHRSFFFLSPSTTTDFSSSFSSPPFER